MSIFTLAEARILLLQTLHKSPLMPLSNKRLLMIVHHLAIHRSSFSNTEHTWHVKAVKSLPFCHASRQQTTASKHTVVQCRSGRGQQVQHQ